MDGRASGRSTRKKGVSSRAVLRDARTLLEQTLQLLRDPVCDEHAAAAPPFALARAQARRMLDQLSRMTRSR
jgi:hypothetical protein